MNVDEIIDVVVKPGSREPGLSREDGALVLRVRERAIEGAANSACLRALAEAYGVAPSAVSLVRGLRSRHKRFCNSPAGEAEGQEEKATR